MIILKIVILVFLVRSIFIRKGYTISFSVFGTVDYLESETLKLQDRKNALDAEDKPVSELRKRRLNAEANERFLEEEKQKEIRRQENLAMQKEYYNKQKPEVTANAKAFAEEFVGQYYSGALRKSTKSEQQYGGAPDYVIDGEGMVVGYMETGFKSKCIILRPLHYNLIPRTTKKAGWFEMYNDNIEHGSVPHLLKGEVPDISSFDHGEQYILVGCTMRNRVFPLPIWNSRYSNSTPFDDISASKLKEDDLVEVWSDNREYADVGYFDRKEGDEFFIKKCDTGYRFATPHNTRMRNYELDMGTSRIYGNDCHHRAHELGLNPNDDHCVVSRNNGRRVQMSDLSSTDNVLNKVGRFGQIHGSPLCPPPVRERDLREGRRSGRIFDTLNDQTCME